MVTKSAKAVEKKAGSKSKAKSKSKPTLKISKKTTAKKTTVDTKKKTTEKVSKPKKENVKIEPEVLPKVSINSAIKHSIIRPDIVKKGNSRKRNLCLNLGKNKETVKEEFKEPVNGVANEKKEVPLQDVPLLVVTPVVSSASTKKDSSINQNATFFYEPSVFKKFDITVTDSENETDDIYTSTIEEVDNIKTDETYDIESEIASAINNVITEIEDNSSDLIEDICSFDDITNDQAEISDNSIINETNSDDVTNIIDTEISDIFNITGEIVEENENSINDGNINSDKIIDISKVKTSIGNDYSPLLGDIDNGLDIVVSEADVDTELEIEKEYDSLIETNSEVEIIDEEVDNLNSSDCAEITNKIDDYSINSEDEVINDINDYIRNISEINEVSNNIQDETNYESNEISDNTQEDSKTNYEVDKTLGDIQNDSETSYEANEILSDTQEEVIDNIDEVTETSDKVEVQDKDIDLNIYFNNYDVLPSENFYEKENSSIENDDYTNGVVLDEAADNIIPFNNIDETSTNLTNKLSFEVAGSINTDVIGFSKPESSKSSTPAFSNIFKKFSFDETNFINSNLNTPFGNSFLQTDVNSLKNDIHNVLNNFEPTAKPLEAIQEVAAANTVAVPEVQVAPSPISDDLSLNDEATYYNNIVVPTKIDNINDDISSLDNEAEDVNYIKDIETIAESDIVNDEASSIESIFEEKLSSSECDIDEKMKEELLTEVLSFESSNTLNVSFDLDNTSEKIELESDVENEILTVGAPVEKNINEENGKIQNNSSEDLYNANEEITYCSENLNKEDFGISEEFSEENIDIEIDKETNVQHTDVAEFFNEGNNFDNIDTLNRIDIQNDISSEIDIDNDPASDLFKMMDSLSDIISKLENEEEALVSSIYDCNTLLISEETQKVYLPYTSEEIGEKLNGSEKYKTVDDVIENEYTVPLSVYKNPISARFKEAYTLMRVKEKSSVRAAIDLGLDLMFTSNLNPAIITACKNIVELNSYLDCLYNNETDKFEYFNIVYKISDGN